MGKALISLILLASSFSAVSAENSLHWGYQGKIDPELWGKFSPAFVLCEKDKNQSPINIKKKLKLISHNPFLNLKTERGK